MSSRQARRRGKALEKRVADILGGQLYPGQAGDVVWGDWVIECKYRHGYRLERQDQLRHWVAQAQENARRQGKAKWCLVVYGGKGTEYLAVLPLTEFSRGGPMNGHRFPDIVDRLLDRLNPATLTPLWERIGELITKQELKTAIEELEKLGLEYAHLTDLAYKLAALFDLLTEKGAEETEETDER